MAFFGNLLSDLKYYRRLAPAQKGVKERMGRASYSAVDDPVSPYLTALVLFL